jgi:MFS family permease
LNVAGDIQRCTVPSALPVLLPLAAGTVALVVVSGVWVVPLYWLCAGVTSGMGMVLQATVLADHVAPERLGRARGILGAVTIVASAAGPSLYGLGIAAGASVAALLWCSVAALIGASLLGTLATQRRRLKVHHAT